MHSSQRLLGNVATTCLSMGLYVCEACPLRRALTRAESDRVPLLVGELGRYPPPAINQLCVSDIGDREKQVVNCDAF